MTAHSDQADGAATPGGAADDGARQSRLGYVAHEIRNPLSTALWTAELLTRLPATERGGARGEKLAAICLRSMVRIRLLIEDHLLCERLDAGDYPLRPEPVRLAEVLAAVEALWPPGDPPPSRPAEPDLMALADRALLVRALDALLAVAGRGAGDETWPIRIEAEATGGRLEIRVAGAPPGSLADPGKGDPSNHRGRSMALPMARRVATALGGTLTVTLEGYLLAIPAA